MQQYPFNPTENGGIGSDPEREAKNRQKRKTGIAAQHAKPKTEVLEKIFDKIDITHCGIPPWSVPFRQRLQHRCAGIFRSHSRGSTHPSGVEHETAARRLSSWSVLFRRKMGTKPEQQICNAGTGAAPDSHFPAMHRLKRKNFEDQKVKCALDRVNEFSHAGVLLSMSGKQPVANHF